MFLMVQGLGSAGPPGQTACWDKLKLELKLKLNLNKEREVNPEGVRGRVVYGLKGPRGGGYVFKNACNPYRFQWFWKNASFPPRCLFLDDFRFFVIFDKKAIENTIVENIQKKQMDEQFFGATVMP